MARKGLPAEGNEGATTGTTKKGRGPIKAGVFVEFAPELASEIKATAARFGNGNAAHTKLAHADITGLVAKTQRDFAAGHIGKIGALYFEELKRRAGNPLEDAVK